MLVAAIVICSGFWIVKSHVAIEHTVKMGYSVHNMEHPIFRKKERAGLSTGVMKKET